MGFFKTLVEAFKSDSEATPATSSSVDSSAPSAVTPVRYVTLRRGTGAVSAVGERHYAKTLRRAWKLIPDHDHVVVALVPEPHNLYDRNAVRMDILVNGEAFTAGYLPNEDAVEYARALRPLEAQGVIGTGDGKIRVDDSGNFHVYARLSEDPKFLVPPVIDDPQGQFIDGLFDLTVTGEEAHQDFLQKNAKRAYPIPFSIGTVTIDKGTHKGKTTFAVYLDGTVVGQLTRAMTEKHFHAIDSVVRSGFRPYLAGRIEKDHRGFQVVLDGPHQPSSWSPVVTA